MNWNERKTFYLQRGKCPIHINENLIPGKTLCQKCIKKNNLWRQERKKEGLCHHCYTRKIVPGKCYCEICIS
jgi:hypothetical protein